MGEADGRFGKKEVEVLMRYAVYRAAELAIELETTQTDDLPDMKRILNTPDRALSDEDDQS